MDRSSSWTNAARNADFAPPSRVARMAMPSPRPPPGSTAEAVATARRSDYGAGGSILPVLPSASPNASKRSSWTTPRSSPVDSMDDDFHQPSSESFAPPPRRAEVASMAAARRAEPTRQCSVSDGLFASETEQAQLEYMEQMYGTINLLNAELEAERRQRAALETAAARPSTYPAKTNYLSVEEDVHIPMGDFDEPPTGFVVSQTPVAPSYSPRKLRTMPSPPSHPPQTQHRVARPPVSPRAIAKEQDEELCATLGKNAELRIRSRDMERTVEKAELELELARKQIKMAERRAENREEKLRALLKEKLSWQKELKVTRAQVVEEKMRQVDLFREVEGAKRHFAAELEAVEQELRSAQEENTQLRTHAAEMKAQINFQTRKMEEMARQAQDEKARFVAMVEDTRHRFREWKEGEAEAIQTAHDLVVRNLKTEYDLKIERHQDEKQKLRDKVNDLEVSMRLLQKDRALSPLELSLRKATILGSKEHTGAIAAEQIETQSRILELENMLVHSQEYQARQESIIKLSEATISRLMQEREVTALENLSLHPFGVEPQPRIEDLSYETHLAGYVTAPSSPARPPGTPPRAHQIPVVKSNEPSVVRSPKSRSHTPRRADLEVSIAQAAEQDSMTNQSANTGSAVPSSREQSLIDELEQLRKALAEAQAKAEAAAKQEVVDMPEVHSGSVSLDENAHSADAADSTIPTKSVEAPIPQDNGRAENSVDADTQNETMTEIKAEDTPEAEDEKHTDPNPTDTATKVPCESPLPAETVSFRDADEERHSDNIVSDVVSADEIHAASSTTEDIEDSREAALNESGLSENLSSDSQSEDTIIADGPSAQEEENISNEISTTGLRDFTGCSDDPVDKVDAHEEDEAPPSPNKFHGDINDVCVVDNEIANSKGTEDAFENTDDAPAKEELVHERESELSDRTVVVADLGLGDDPVPDESDAAPLATTNVELVEETDRPSQLSTEDPVADSNNSGIEDQDQPSRDNAEQVDNSVEPPNTTQGSVCSAAEVLGDENVGTVAAMSAWE
ncbi:uncharacterized protein IUM83_03128 [Phytophthora cinnamomi]|uniref:uncharacterized protein n=1 Tax=Phytophthora cinnamomi TaxID=4785 RepID=UPI0035596CE9|nr:hypothetical protein IUM83_03128 [Phytophthora cinnamomi]